MSFTFNIAHKIIVQTIIPKLVNISKESTIFFIAGFKSVVVVGV